MSTFIANGTIYTKSSWSETDWTKQCIGVAGCNCIGRHMQLADSVTASELTGFSRREFLSMLAAAK